MIPWANGAIINNGANFQVVVTALRIIEREERSDAECLQRQKSTGFLPQVSCRWSQLVTYGHNWSHMATTGHTWSWSRIATPWLVKGIGGCAKSRKRVAKLKSQRVALKMTQGLPVPHRPTFCWQIIDILIPVTYLLSQFYKISSRTGPTCETL